MTDVSTTRAGGRYPGVWAILSLVAAVTIAARVLRSIVTGELPVPFMSTIQVVDSPYAFYGILIALALIVCLSALGSWDYWREWKMKRQHVGR